MTKKERKLQKEIFMKEYAADLVSCYSAKIYPHFIKIKIKDIEYDFYPGSERLMYRKDNEFIWQDCTINEFMNLI